MIYSNCNLLNKEVVIIHGDVTNRAVDATILSICEPFIWIKYKLEPDAVQVIPIDAIASIKIKDETLTPPPTYTIREY